MALEPEDLKDYSTDEMVASALQRANAAYNRGSYRLARLWASEAQAMAKDAPSRRQAAAIVGISDFYLTPKD